MKPVLLTIFTRYEIRNPIFHLPNIRHSFGEQSISYCLIIKQLNAEKCSSTLTTNMVHTESFLIYKICNKRNVIVGCNDHCEIDSVMYVTDKTIGLSLFSMT